MIDNVLDYSFGLLGRNPFPVLLQKSPDHLPFLILTKVIWTATATRNNWISDSGNTRTSAILSLAQSVAFLAGETSS
jgi:hypothetical protein